MSKAAVSASLLMMLLSGFIPAHAEEPGDVVVGIYAKHPWADLPPGGHGAWYMDIAAAWERGSADDGMTLLLGKIERIDKVETEVVVSSGDEARVRATVSGKDGATQVLNFGMVGDDDEDDRWRVIEVFTDDGKYLSEVLAGE
ncbi:MULTISPECIES: hypothetical protein [unclassified Shinella]|uniref:hypothetical protein n=1 Tax=unclassified Shinella TaxID=2643062 RepID=UPI00234FB0BD|nr:MULTISPECIES: hypothetical protein [unclassified Shinella]MCO5139959.1 hypothetical protein [Shinella sp.]MDC7257026.1 hypothetical protein [Shinella sp. YE25]